jgi:hypothetical protein
MILRCRVVTSNKLPAKEKPMSESDVVQKRLEDQIGWYDRNASYNERMFKILRIATIVVSSSIPLSAAFVEAKWITGGLGALIALFEGLQQLNQHHQNWITYRSTAEALKHEKYLFLSLAGPYASSDNPKTLLAERVESLVSQENSKWTAAIEQITREKHVVSH